MKEEIVSFIRRAIEAHGYQGVLIGVSGGIDSAVVGALAVRAMGKEKVLGILLPERDSAPETLRDSLLVCRHLGIERVVKPITGVLRSLGIYRMQPSTFLIPRKVQEKYVRQRINTLGGNDFYVRDLQNDGNPAFLKGLAYYRAKHRVRMVHLYLEAEARNYAVLGTTNRTEAVTGLYVKWGDDSADIEPIAHLYKTQVCRLAEELALPEAIRAKPPSPDLIPGITDEDVLGMSYAELDAILMQIEKGHDLRGMEPVKVQKVLQILKAAGKRNLRNLSLLEKQPLSSPMFFNGEPSS